MRRAWVLALAVIALAVMPGTLGLAVGDGSADAAPNVASAPPTTVPSTDEPATTALDNPFLPEDANIGDCVSALPRPECGSNARGGWRQTLVFAAVLAGMAVIGWRLAVSVRRRDRPQPTS